MLVVACKISYSLILLVMLLAALNAAIVALVLNVCGLLLQLLLLSMVLVAMYTAGANACQAYECCDLFDPMCIMGRCFCCCCHKFDMMMLLLVQDLLMQMQPSLFPEVGQYSICSVCTQCTLTKQCLI